MTEEFWRIVHDSLANQDETRLPPRPEGVFVKFEGREAIPVDVAFAGRRDGTDNWLAVLPWPQGTPLPPGPVQVLIDELPPHSAVRFQVRWI